MIFRTPNTFFFKADVLLNRFRELVNLVDCTVPLDITIDFKLQWEPHINGWT